MKFDAVIVLAGGIQSDGRLPKTVEKRIDLAYQIFHKGLADHFLLSGKWSVFWDHQPPRVTEARLMKKYALKIGLNPKNLLLEEHSQNTFENAFYSIKLFAEPRSWQKILVITSDFHLQRCRKIFSYLNKNNHDFYFIGAKTNGGWLRKSKWFIKEKFLSNTQWLFQYFLDR